MSWNKFPEVKEVFFRKCADESLSSKELEGLYEEHFHAIHSIFRAQTRIPLFNSVQVVFNEIIVLLNKFNFIANNHKGVYQGIAQSIFRELLSIFKLSSRCKESQQFLSLESEKLLKISLLFLLYYLVHYKNHFVFSNSREYFYSDNIYSKLYSTFYYYCMQYIKEEEILLEIFEIFLKSMDEEKEKIHYYIYGDKSNIRILFLREILTHSHNQIGYIGQSFKKEENIKRLMELGYDKIGIHYRRIFLSQFTHNINIVKLLIEEYQIPYDLEDNNFTLLLPLYYSCLFENIKVICYLLNLYKRDGKISQLKEKHLFNLLSACCENGNLDILKYLIEEFDYIPSELEMKEEFTSSLSLSPFASIFNPVKKEPTLASIAARHNQREVLNYLLENLAILSKHSVKEICLEVNVKSKLDSLVISALQGNHFHLALELLDKKISIIPGPTQPSFISCILLCKDLNLIAKIFSKIDNINLHFLFRDLFLHDSFTVFVLLLDKYEEKIPDYVINQLIPLSIINRSAVGMNLHRVKMISYFLNRYPHLSIDYKNTFLGHWVSVFNPITSNSLQGSSI